MRHRINHSRCFGVLHFTKKMQLQHVAPRCNGVKVTRQLDVFGAVGENGAKDANLSKLQTAVRELEALEKVRDVHTRGTRTPRCSATGRPVVTQNARARPQGRTSETPPLIEEEDILMRGRGVKPGDTWGLTLYGLSEWHVRAVCPHRLRLGRTPPRVRGRSLLPPPPAAATAHLSAMHEQRSAARKPRRSNSAGGL